MQEFMLINAGWIMAILIQIGIIAFAAVVSKTTTDESLSERSRKMHDHTAKVLAEKGLDEFQLFVPTQSTFMMGGNN